MTMFILLTLCLLPGLLFAPSIPIPHSIKPVHWPVQHLKTGSAPRKGAPIPARRTQQQQPAQHQPHPLTGVPGAQHPKVLKKKYPQKNGPHTQQKQSPQQPQQSRPARGRYQYKIGVQRKAALEQQKKPRA